MDFITLPPLTVLDIVGRDAARVLNNLCTAAVLPLLEGEGCEAFITEVRGRTLGHVCVYRVGQSLRLIGAGGQAATIAAHLDRYTIREDAAAEDRSATWSGLLLDENGLRRLDPSLHLDAPPSPQALAWRRMASSVDDRSVDDRSAGRSPDQAGLRSAERSATEGGLIAYSVPWTGKDRWLVAGPEGEIKELADWLRTQGAQALDESTFHRQRVLHRFPWFGIDLDDRNLPQEADRDALAISFTKGCYLGQETVARLDALGQVQKKLVVWRISGSEPPAAGTELSHDGRVVGRLTSIVADSPGGGYLALGFARRSHFEAGAEAQMQRDNGRTSLATVI